MSSIRESSGPSVMARHASVGGGRSTLLKSCKQVEGLFLCRLLDAMDQQPFGEGMIGNSAGSTAFRAQRNQAIADEMGMRGDLGLADMLYAELSSGGDGS